MHKLMQQQSLRTAIPSVLSLIIPAPVQDASGLRAASSAFVRFYSVAQPTRTPDGFLRFPVQQPPSRLTLLFPFTQADVKVVTGGYETLQVKVGSIPKCMQNSLCPLLPVCFYIIFGVQVTGGASPYEIEYDGSHVGQSRQLRLKTTLS